MANALKVQTFFGFLAAKIEAQHMHFPSVQFVTKTCHITQEVGSEVFFKASQN